MKPRVYLETTVRYLAARSSRDPWFGFDRRSRGTGGIRNGGSINFWFRRLWRRNARLGDAAQVARRQTLLEGTALLPSNEAILELAEALMVPGVIPPTAAPDGLHIAAAVVHRCDYLLTWNLRHIANAQIRRVVEEIVERKGYARPTICTPEELF